MTNKRKRPTSRNGVAIPYTASTLKLLQLIESGAPHCWAAYVALGQHPDRPAFSALVSASASADWSHRRAAAEQIGHHELGHEAVPRLRQLLSDSSHFVVQAACKALCMLNATEAMVEIRELLDSMEPETRQTALSVLSLLPEDSSFDPVLGVFRNDKNSEVRKSAGWCLRELATPEDWAVLFDLWVNDSLPRHRVWACQLALRHGVEQRRADLQRLTSDPDGHVRSTAVSALRNEPTG